jgi:dolichol-phosphate mannosyltransferase
MLSKYTIALVGLAALAYLLLDRPSRRWFRSPAPYAAAFAAILCFLPVVVWNYQNDWASFVFQGPRRWDAEPRFQLPALFLYVLALITPLGVLGFLGGFRRPDRGLLFCLVFSLVPVSVFVIASLRQETRLNWTGPAWLAALPLIVRSMMPAIEGAASRNTDRLHRFWKPCVLALMLFYGAILHYGALGLPGAPGVLGPIGPSWRDLGGQVEEIGLNVIKQTGIKPLVVGMDKYRLASLLAFYDPCGDGAGETASRGLFGGRGLMYDAWFPPVEQAGRALVLVSGDAEALDTPGVRGRVKDTEPLREIRVRSRGCEAVSYFVRVVHAYQPADPARGPPVTATNPSGTPSGGTSWPRERS